MILTGRIAVSGSDPPNQAPGSAPPNIRSTSSSSGPAVDQPGAAPGLLEQAPVASQPGEGEVREPGLARPEQLALAPQLEVDLGQLEAVGRVDERLQPLAGRLRELLLRA